MAFALHLRMLREIGLRGSGVVTNAIKERALKSIHVEEGELYGLEIHIASQAKKYDHIAQYINGIDSRGSNVTCLR